MLRGRGLDAIVGGNSLKTINDVLFPLIACSANLLLSLFTPFSRATTSTVEVRRDSTAVRLLSEDLRRQTSVRPRRFSHGHAHLAGMLLLLLMMMMMMMPLL